MKSTALAKFSATKVGFVFNLLSSLVRYFPVFTNIPIMPEFRAPSISSNASFKKQIYKRFNLIMLYFIKIFTSPIIKHSSGCTLNSRTEAKKNSLQGFPTTSAFLPVLYSSALIKAP